MNDLFSSEYAVFTVLVLIGLIILYIAIALAILKIPKIVKNTRATMMLTALMAKEQGVEKELIETIVNEADNTVMTDNEGKFYNTLYDKE